MENKELVIGLCELVKEFLEENEFVKKLDCDKFNDDGVYDRLIPYLYKYVEVGFLENKESDFNKYVQNNLEGIKSNLWDHLQEEYETLKKEKE